MKELTESPPPVATSTAFVTESAATDQALSQDTPCVGLCYHYRKIGQLKAYDKIMKARGRQTDKTKQNTYIRTTFLYHCNLSIILSGIPHDAKQANLTNGQTLHWNLSVLPEDGNCATSGRRGAVDGKEGSQNTTSSACKKYSTPFFFN